MELEDGNSGLAKVPENELLRRAVEIGRHRVGRGNIPFVWPENRTDVAQLEHANDCLARALQTETDGVRVLQDPGQARSDGFGALVRRRTKGENTESMSFYVIEGQFGPRRTFSHRCGNRGCNGALDWRSQRFKKSAGGLSALHHYS